MVEVAFRGPATRAMMKPMIRIIKNFGISMAERIVVRSSPNPVSVSALLPAMANRETAPQEQQVFAVEERRLHQPSRFLGSSFLPSIRHINMMRTGTQIMIFMASTPSSPKDGSVFRKLPTGPVITTRGMRIPRNMVREEPPFLTAVPRETILSFGTAGILYLPT